MTIMDFIQNNYKDLQLLAKKITHGHQNSNDLLNDCLFDILNRMPNIEVGKELNFISKMIKTQYNSKTSPFYLIYRNPYGTQSLEEPHDMEDEPVKEDNTDKLATEISIYINGLNIYEKTVAQRHFINGVSQRELSKHYNINRIHISKTINTVKREIKQNFKRHE